MQIYYSGNEKELKKLVAQPIFEEFMTYLDQNPDVTLRELNQEFPNQSLERFIEKLVENKLISRANRRYHSLIPYIKNYPAEVIALSNQMMAEFKEKQTSKLLELNFFEELWEQVLTQEVFFLSDLIVPRKTVIKNEQLQLITFDNGAFQQVSLPNYFYMKEKLPDNYQELADLLGDLEESYFVDQLQMILERMNAGTWRLKQKNIFYEALGLTGVIKKGQVQLTTLPTAENVSPVHNQIIKKLKELDTITAVLTAQRLLGKLLDEDFKGSATYQKWRKSAQ